MKRHLLIPITILLISTGMFVYTLFTSSIGEINFGTENLSIAASSSTANNTGLTVNNPSPINNPQDPLTLVIPKIGVKARVERVGIDWRGNIGIPSTFYTVAWYRLGPRPGAAGTAIISGHLDNGLGLSGVFKKLNQLQVGDVITIQDRGGRLIQFRVSRVEIAPYKSSSTEILAKTATPQIVLITCDGAWVKNARTYDHRLMVWATLVS